MQRGVEHLLWQADACRALGSPLYGRLLDRCARDLADGGATAGVLEGHLHHRRGEVIPLRMLAGVHAVVLTGGAPDLAAFYPSAGGTADVDSPELWPAFRRVLVDSRDVVRRWLDHPPQTNEVGRSAPLLGGLCHVVADADRPVRLVEIGASAGLNLRADRFRVEGAVASFGPASSPVVLRDGWRGVPPPDVTVDVAVRLGIDIAPVDPTTDDGRLRLTAFVWPDQVERFERLRGALEVAAAVPAELRAGDAVEAAQDLELAEGTWTVLWHSVFRQYLDAGAQVALGNAVAALGRRASRRAGFAYLHLEPLPDSPADAFPVTLTTWPGGRERRLATAPAHGVPTTWLR